jgi:hypothetical protein
MQRRLIGYLVLAVALVLAYAALQRWPSIAALSWHWRNGDTTVLDGYVIPVPSDWWASQQGRDSLLLIDVSNKSGMITVITRRTKTKDLAFWNGLEKSRVAKRGVTRIVDREFSLGQEKLSCIGGPVDKELQVALNPTISYSCMSDGRLSILLIGPPEKIESALTLISQIRPQQVALQTGTKPH